MKRMTVTILIALIFTLGTTASSFASTTESFEFPYQTLVSNHTEKISTAAESRKGTKKTIGAKTLVGGKKAIKVKGKTYTFQVQQRIPKHTVQLWSIVSKTNNSTERHFFNTQYENVSTTTYVTTPTIKGYKLKVVKKFKRGVSHPPKKTGSVSTGTSFIHNESTLVRPCKAAITYKKLNKKSFRITYAVPFQETRCEKHYEGSGKIPGKYVERTLKYRYTYFYLLTYTKR